MISIAYVLLCNIGFSLPSFPLRQHHVQACCKCSGTGVQLISCYYHAEEELCRPRPTIVHPSQSMPHFGCCARVCRC